MTRRKRAPLPSQAELNRLFEYDPDTGNLLWRFRQEMAPWRNTRHAGKVAGCLTGGGYVCVWVGGLFQAHRLIWKMLHGDEPEQLDHCDGNRANNRPSNLRVATHAQNARNRTKRKEQALFKGVQHKRCGAYRAYIKVGGKQHHLGTFSSPECAHLAYCLAAVRYHGEFARFR